MRDVYSSSHIVTLPSFGEGMPTTLLEAASAGRPIVATDVPGCRDVVTDGLNGYLVPPRDAAALASALLKLAADGALRRQMGAEGRRLVLEKFTHTRINAENFGVYNQLLKQPSTA
jgi:glycosyltransferase involved in cell wall biosynthesis